MKSNILNFAEKVFLLNSRYWSPKEESENSMQGLKTSRVCNRVLRGNVKLFPHLPLTKNSLPSPAQIPSSLFPHAPHSLQCLPSPAPIPSSIHILPALIPSRYELFGDKKLYIAKRVQGPFFGTFLKADGYLFDKA